MGLLRNKNHDFLLSPLQARALSLSLNLNAVIPFVNLASLKVLKSSFTPEAQRTRRKEILGVDLSVCG